MTTTPDMIQCPVCEVWFNNTDNSFVCPNGHEPPAEDRVQSVPEPVAAWRNWRRISERFMWVICALDVLVCAAAVVGGHWPVAAASFFFAMSAAGFALQDRERAYLADYETVIRVYRRGRLYFEGRSDHPPVCGCGEVHE